MRPAVYALLLAAATASVGADDRLPGWGGETHRVQLPKGHQHTTDYMHGHHITGGLPERHPAPHVDISKYQQALEGAQHAMQARRQYANSHPHGGGGFGGAEDGSGAHGPHWHPDIKHVDPEHAFHHPGHEGSAVHDSKHVHELSHAFVMDAAAHGAGSRGNFKELMRHLKPAYRDDPAGAAVEHEWAGHINQRAHAQAHKEEEEEEEEEEPMEDVPLSSDLISNQLCLVLPTRLDGNETPRLFGLLLSLLQNFKPAKDGTYPVHTLFVIVPDQEVDDFKAVAIALERFAAGGPLFAIEVMGEAELFSGGINARQHFSHISPKTTVFEERGGGRGIGYRMQMLTKIGIAKFVPTEFYLTLDSDVVLTRPTSLNDLIVSGRGILQGKMRSEHSSRWFKSSATIIGADFSACTHNIDTVGLTPAILSTDVSTWTMKRIARKYAGRFTGAVEWDEILFAVLDTSLDWTEYSLYWMGACHSGLADKVHTHTNLSLYSEAGFTFGNWRAFSASKAFNDRTHVFHVLQGIAGSTPRWAMNVLAPVLVREDRGPALKRKHRPMLRGGGGN